MADGWLTGQIDAYGTPAVGALMFLENVIPPIPSELIMPLAGALAARGEMTFAGIALAGTAGSLAGQTLIYALGRWLGADRVRRLVERLRWLGFKGSDVDKAQAWFDRHGAWAVLLCRLVPGVRSLISLPAGIARMRLLPFLALSLLGTSVWTVALAWAGWELGERWDRVGHWLGPVSTGVMALLVVAAVVVVIRRRRRPDG